MSKDEATSALKDLEAAVAQSRADRAIESAVRGIRAKVAPMELVRTASRTAAVFFDPSLRRPPHGLVALAAAANLCGILQPRFHSLPILQAIALAAAEKKASRPGKAPAVVSGEITHLGRSFMLAARDGNLPEAESIFLGMLAEGRERRMAGDLLFRAAAEDLGDGGQKLIVCVKLWQLASVLAFKDARTILRPTVQYLVAGPRDSRDYQAIRSALGQEGVDLEALGTDGRGLDDAGRVAVDRMLASRDRGTRFASTLALLRDGYAPSSLAEELSARVSRALGASNTYEPDRVRTLAYAHCARFVLSFTRTSERLYALFQTTHRLPPSIPPPVPPSEPGLGEGEELCQLAGELEAGKAHATGIRSGFYLARGFSPDRLFDTLAHHASRDSAIVNDGLNLLLADVCASEFLATRAPEHGMALATMIAASPRDRSAYDSWSGLLGP